MPLIAGVLVLAACSGGSDKDAKATVYSTLGVPGPMLCDFVPRAEVAAMLGTDELTEHGELRGREGSQPLTDANCSVRRRGDNQGLALSAWVEHRGSRENESTDWLIKHPSPSMTPYPAGNPIGVANPARGTGAVATALVGDWYIRVLLDPQAEGCPAACRAVKGRNPVVDAQTLVQRIVAALQLPTQASQTYPPYVPHS